MHSFATATRYSAHTSSTAGATRLILEEAIGSFAPRARPAGLRDGGGRLLGEGRRDHAQPFVETLIGQLGASEFVAGPAGRLSRWRTKGGRIGFKHPPIKYISDCGTMR